MKASKILFAAIAAILFIAAAVVAIYIFRNEIADFLVEVKAKIDEKIPRQEDEYVE